MPEYKYTGRTLSGQLSKGVITANNPEHASSQLREKKIYPIKIEEENDRDISEKLRFSPRVKTKSLALFCRQFYSMLDAGIPIVESLGLLAKQTTNKRLKKATDFLCEEVQKGSLLSSAMKKKKEIFPNMLIYMVETGEVSGQLDAVMGRMAEHYEKETKLQSKIKNAMMYPMIVSIVAVLVIWFLITYVLPTFINMFAGFGAALPLPTRILLGVSSAFRNYWYLILGGLILLILAYKMYVKSQSGRYRIDLLKLRMPIFGNVNKKVATSRFARTLSRLLMSGINIIEAMDIVHKVIGNEVISRGISRSMDNIRKGGGITGPLGDLNVFPPVLISMMKIGEESGSMDAMLAKTADFYDQEVDSAIEKMTTLLEPLIIVVLAIIIGMIILAVVTPMFDMYQFVG